MRLRVVLATLVAMLAATVGVGTAQGHELPGGFSMTLTPSLFEVDDQKMGDLQAAARMAQSQPASTNRSARCAGGMAAIYPCENVNLLGHLTLPEIGGGEIANDMWGWVDRRTKREYAIVGKTNGTAFVDITNPRKPWLVAHMRTQSAAGGQFWRDIKVYKDHAFVVSEHTGHGMQVFDLERLREIRRSQAPAAVEADTVYTGVSNTHNLDINTESGYAYLVGTSTCHNGTQHGGLHMVDIRDPRNPTFAGCALAEPPALPITNYVHDSQCVNYDGPDRRYRGREICFGSNEEAVTIYDVTDKSDPRVISQRTYPQASYTHQGWLAKGGRYFVFNDELDELSGRAPEGRQTTYIVGVEDLENPGTVMASPNNTPSTDHNLYVKDEVIYESNYSSGLRLFDEDTVPSGDLREVGYFDVYPEDDEPGFHGGTWSNYSRYRDDDIVGVSSMDRGLFVLETDLGGRDDDDGDSDSDD